MTKQEFIKQAFGKSWNKLSYGMQEHILTRHHWVDRSSNRMNLSPADLGFKESDCEISCEFWRPIALKGIEDNNGWIKLESEADFPKEKGIYKWLTKSGFTTTFDFEPSDRDEQFSRYSHWKPVLIELLPLY